MAQQQTHQSNKSAGGKAATQPGYGSVSAAEIEKYIAGIHFPCDKEGLLECARDNNAPQEVLDIMEEFSDQNYRSPVDVSRQMSQTRH